MRASSRLISLIQERRLNTRTVVQLRAVSQWISMTVAAYDVYFLKATVNVHANITQPKNDRECFTAERVSRVPADLAEFFSVSSTRLQESILLKRCFRAVYGLGRDRRADPGYHFTFHLIPVVKCMRLNAHVHNCCLKRASLRQTCSRFS